MATLIPYIEVDELDEQIIEEPDTKIDAPLLTEEEIESIKDEEEEELTHEDLVSEEFESTDEPEFGEEPVSEKLPEQQAPKQNRPKNPRAQNKNRTPRTRGSTNRSSAPRARPYKRQDDRHSHSDPFPEDARSFISKVYKAMLNKNEDLTPLYEVWQRFSVFKNSIWPSIDLIRPIVDDDKLFVLLYNELVHRRSFYETQTPSFTLRQAAWKNYLDLFETLKNHSIDLPLHWVWDIINEFVYQWQAFLQFRTYATKPNNFEAIKSNQSVWDTCQVLKSLCQMMEASHQSNPSNLAKNLGYFAHVGLFRVNCLIGDYHGALQAVEPLGIDKPRTHSQKPPYQAVPTCFVTLFYHSGLCKMMTRKYSEAIKTFTQALTYTNRLLTRYSDESVIKRSEQILTLLAVCLSLCRQKVTDEQVATELQEKLGDKMTKMQAGHEETFHELMLKSLPKFVHPAPPPYDQMEKNPSAITSHNTQVLQNQLQVFMSDVRQQLFNTRIRAYLRLYSSVEISKLATFLEMNQETLKDYLMCYRHKTRHFSNETHFTLEKNMIHIQNVRQPKLFQGLFLYFLHKMEHENNELAKIKIPIKHKN